MGKNTMRLALLSTVGVLLLTLSYSSVDGQDKVATQDPAKQLPPTPKGYDAKRDGSERATMDAMARFPPRSSAYPR